jgi:excisionase family DNA binding protein
MANAPFHDSARAELVGPLAHDSGGDELTISQAAKLAGVSASTMARRVADGELPASKDGRTWRLSKQVVLEVGPALRRRDAPKSRAERARDRGALAARAFPLFETATPLPDVVVRLEADPDEVLVLHERWLALRERTAAWLADPPPAATGPVFDHPASEDGSCCPGHLAALRMKKEPR